MRVYPMPSGIPNYLPVDGDCVKVYATPSGYAYVIDFVTDGQDSAGQCLYYESEADAYEAACLVLRFDSVAFFEGWEGEAAAADAAAVAKLDGAAAGAAYPPSNRGVEKSRGEQNQ